jgi:hypothetical protein
MLVSFGAPFRVVVRLLITAGYWLGFLWAEFTLCLLPSKPEYILEKRTIRLSRTPFKKSENILFFLHKKGSNPLVKIVFRLSFALAEFLCYCHLHPLSGCGAGLSSLNRCDDSVAGGNNLIAENNTDNNSSNNHRGKSAEKKSQKKYLAHALPPLPLLAACLLCGSGG